MMRFIDLWIGVQLRVVHDTINQVIYDGGNRIDAPEPVIERFLGWRFLAMGLIRHASPSFHWKHPTPRHLRRLTTCGGADGGYLGLHDLACRLADVFQTRVRCQAALGRRGGLCHPALRQHTHRR